MAQTYIITQGDHLSGIAEKFGFHDFESIWSHANNQALKSQRKDPHVLLPGDKLFIPDKAEKTVPVATAKVHRFQTTAKPLLLRIALKDFDNSPIANSPCELEVEGAVQKLTTDAEGKIQARISKAARKGTLKIPDFALEVPLKIGYLDPVEEDTGWQGRLINLGYYDGAVGDADEEMLRYAVEEFQCDHGLKISGDADAATQAKLKEIHGA